MILGDLEQLLKMLKQPGTKAVHQLVFFYSNFINGTCESDTFFSP